MKNNRLANVLESILYISGDGIDAETIAEKLNVTADEVLKAAAWLQQEKYTEESGIVLTVYNSKMQLSTNAAYVEEISAVLNPIRERELSKSMLETIAIVAYKQPVSRLDLEEIRGTNSEYALQKLLDIGLVQVVGNKDALGKPSLFGTTDEFLKRFELKSLNDLPDYETILKKIRAQEIGSGDADSTYLYRKDEYISESAAAFDDQTSLDEITFDEEDIPEFVEEADDPVNA